MRKLAATAVLIATLLPAALRAAESPKEENAATLYLRAAQIRKPVSPAETNMEYRDYPPFPQEWTAASEDAWNANGQVRALARQARTMTSATWPDSKDATYLNFLRGFTNDIDDAALHEAVHGHAAAAVELTRDVRHLADLLEEKPSKDVLRVLVASGINACACNRLLVIVAADAKFTADPKNTVDLNVATARQVIKELLDQRDPKQQLTEILGPAGTPAWHDPKLDTDRLIETMNRVNAERTFAAMSLAAHLYRFEKHTWPGTLDQLFPDYLPRVPIDPWGDGKQTFGYALIEAGRPDGADRPLVYDRCRATDGLQYRTDEPQFSFYQQDGSNRPPKQRIQAGQFRDLTTWPPQNHDPTQPAVKPLP